MYHMKTASIRDLRYAFKKIERLLHQGEEIQITKRRRVIARLVPEGAESLAEVPDFLGRLRKIYGEKALTKSGAQLLAEDRSRSCEPMTPHAYSICSTVPSRILPSHRY